MAKRGGLDERFCLDKRGVFIDGRREQTTTGCHRARSAPPTGRSDVPLPVQEDQHMMDDCLKRKKHKKRCHGIEKEGICKNFRSMHRKQFCHCPISLTENEVDPQLQSIRRILNDLPGAYREMPEMMRARADHLVSEMATLMKAVKCMATWRVDRYGAVKCPEDCESLELACQVALERCIRSGRLGEAVVQISSLDCQGMGAVRIVGLEALHHGTKLLLQGVGSQRRLSRQQLQAAAKLASKHAGSGWSELGSRISASLSSDLEFYSEAQLAELRGDVDEMDFHHFWLELLRTDCPDLCEKAGLLRCDGLIISGDSLEVEFRDLQIQGFGDRTVDLRDRAKVKFLGCDVSGRGNGVSACGSASLKAERCHIRNCGFSGVFLNDTSGTCEFNRCTITGNSNAGVVIRGPGVQGLQGLQGLWTMCLQRFETHRELHLWHHPL